MGADLDFTVSETVEQLEKWGHWFSEMTKIDGFRLDAISNILINGLNREQSNWIKNFLLLASTGLMILAN